MPVTKTNLMVSHNPAKGRGRTLTFHVDLDENEVVSHVNTRVYELVAQRLADDLYAKHRETFLRCVNPDNLVKRAAARLDGLVSKLLKSALKERL